MEQPPKFWQSARAGTVTAWGWSARSAEEAFAVAGERLAVALKAIRSGLPRTAARLRTYRRCAPTI
ncbi:hypothetical protein [Flexivirga caeni]|uniref:Uncharacterized protein n=1 Tax=Flexivirga caeni TaxID=2294115 RepID=A0A3M9MFL5_9MICO|nr:hypothetical protein [Flexivirga caeni]RNI24350.1 hypothetical protein EFY87_05150 [Flexivirga caeni]